MATHKYLEKYPSKTRPGKFIYKYEEGSGSLYGDKIGNSSSPTLAEKSKALKKKKVQSANRQKRLAMDRNYVFKRNPPPNDKFGYQYSTRNNAKNMTTDYYKKDSNNLFGRKNTITGSRYTGVFEETGVLDRTARKVGSYVSSGANTVKSYASATISSIESAGSKAISSGKSFIDSLFGKKKKNNVRYDDYPY